jgi:hypothetical protein
VDVVRAQNVTIKLDVFSKTNCQCVTKRDDTFCLKLLSIDERKPMPEEGSKEGSVSFQVRAVQDEAKSNKRHDSSLPSIPYPTLTST